MQIVVFCSYLLVLGEEEDEVIDSASCQCLQL